MEKTTRPTQVRTRAPLNQRTGQKSAQNSIYSQGAGETGGALQGGGQQGQWASHLSNGYEHRLAGQEPESWQNGREVQEPNQQNERMAQGRRGRPLEQDRQNDTGRQEAGQQNMRETSGEREAREVANNQRGQGVNEARNRPGRRMYQEAMGKTGGQELDRGNRGILGGTGSQTDQEPNRRNRGIGAMEGRAGQQPGRQPIGIGDRQSDSRWRSLQEAMKKANNAAEQELGGSRRATRNQGTEQNVSADRNRTNDQSQQEDTNQRYGRGFQKGRSRINDQGQQERADQKADKESKPIDQGNSQEDKKEKEQKLNSERQKENKPISARETSQERGKRSGREIQNEKERQSNRTQKTIRQEAQSSRERQDKEHVKRLPPGTGNRKPADRRIKQTERPSAQSQYTSRRLAEDRQEFQTENFSVPKTPPRPKRRPGSGVNFLIQGSILAVAGIIVRLIGMVYRIPLARKIGDNGNGYYNAAYSIYSILLIMSSYSLPTAVSKMVSARLAKGEYRTSTRIFRAAMFYATIAGMAGFCALWFGADYFASQIIRMPYSSYALKALAPTIWIMAYLGVLRGYFQGHSTMIPTAMSQVFEQVVNAIVSIVAASMLFDVGVKSNLVFHDTEYSYAFGAAGGAIGTGAGAVTALVFFMLLALAYRPTMRKKARRDRGAKVESYRGISQALFATIIPIIISSAIYNISNVVDNSLFGHVMEKLGESNLTASQWGVYMGRYHLLFNIPVAIANSLSSSLIPTLSRAMTERNRRQVHARIATAIRFSMIIAIPSAVGLTVLAEPVSDLLFSGMDNTMLIKMMAVGSSAVVFFSLSTVSNAILQGINRMNMPIINSAISLAIHIGVLYVMLKFFHMGIYSVVYANILFAALVCLLNAISIARYVKYRQELLKTFLIPALASAAMGGAAWGTYQLCIKAGNNSVSTAAIMVAVIVYFVLLILFKGIDEQELKKIPGGTKLVKVAKILHVM